MAYKIVIDHGKRYGLRSAVPLLSRECSIRYTPHLPTRSDLGPLFVFKLLEDAIRGVPLLSYAPLQIWRCRTKNLREQSTMLKWFSEPSLILCFWRGEAKGAFMTETIKGTYVADEVTLTKRVR